MIFRLSGWLWPLLALLGSASSAGPGTPAEPPVLITSDDEAPIKPANLFLTAFGNAGRWYLTYGSDVNIQPSWSYDGTKIAYTSNRGGNYAIWAMDAGGNNKTQLTSSVGTTPAFSPDGAYIAYTGFQTGHAEVWVMNADGTNQRQLTTTTRSATKRDFSVVVWSMLPSFSPDGTKIVYASTQGGNSQIWLMNADGTNQTQLTFPGYPAAPDANAPAWSPDGTKIAFWSGYTGEYGEIWVIDPDGSGRKRLTAYGEGVNSDNPTWSPDGRHIVFESNRGPNPDPRKSQTWIMDCDGSNPGVLFPFSVGAGRRPWRTFWGNR
jgi:Tol biopolymer transport system component